MAAEQNPTEAARAEARRTFRARLAATGVVITDADIEAARAKFAALQPISDAQHAKNLAWLDGTG